MEKHNDHDLFGPATDLELSLMDQINSLRAALAQAQADANRLRVAAEFNCDAMSEEDWPNECSGCGRVATLAGPECFCADCFRNHWAQAQAERDAAYAALTVIGERKDAATVRGDTYRRRALVLTAKLKRERLAANDCIDDAITEKQMAEVAYSDVCAERDAANRAAYAAEVLADERRDAATRRAEQAEAVAARLLALADRWDKRAANAPIGMTITAGALLAHTSELRGVAALAGPEGGV